MPAAVLAYINADLGPDPKYPWITVCWNLGAAIIVTVGGRLADIFGRRYFLLTGAVAAAIGALVGATGQSITQMIISGVLFGFGGGFQEMCFACAQELVPNRYRFATLGIMIFANHISSFGPLIAYAFITYTNIGWRSCYWFCFAFESSTAIMLFFFYKPPSFETKHGEDHKTKWQLVKEMDHVGLWLFTFGCLLLLLGLNWVRFSPIGTAFIDANGHREVYRIRGVAPTSSYRLFWHSLASLHSVSGKSTPTSNTPFCLRSYSRNGASTYYLLVPILVSRSKAVSNNLQLHRPARRLFRSRHVILQYDVTS
jgi:MFS family permease